MATLSPRKTLVTRVNDMSEPTFMPSQKYPQNTHNKDKHMTEQKTIAIPANTLLVIAHDSGKPSVQDTETALGNYLTLHDIDTEELASLSDMNSLSEPGDSIGASEKIVQFMLKNKMIAPQPSRKLQIVPGSKNGLKLTTL